MADFVNEFWNWFIIAGVVLGLLFCVLLLIANSKPIEGEGKPTGHVWDETLEELNNPMPKWWLNMFYITIVFAVIYLALYPGLGNFQGFLGWSSAGSYDQEVTDAEKKYGPLYAAYLATPIEELAKNKNAVATAKRIFASNCQICHGSDARGANGFPNLIDDAWLFGGEEAAVKTSITNGRNAVMPAWGGILGEDGVNEVSEYVYSLSRESKNPALAEAGGVRYKAMCQACHAADATGNPALGAPNLADKIWLYGGSIGAIKSSISEGRNGKMPAFADHLNESQIHLLATYLHSAKSK